MSFIEFQNVIKSYKSGESEVLANNDLSFSIEKGEFCVILGPSGAGKSTTLNILGGLDQNDSGKVIVAGKNISNFNEEDLTKYRRYQIGFVFQNYNLIGNLTARENIEMASHLVKDALDPLYALEAVGLKNKSNNFPAQLSGGEQQRVSIARAMAKNPGILLCDEPTGALDYETGKAILKQLQKTCSETGTTVIIVTHNSAIKPIANRVIEMVDGGIRSIQVNDHPISIDKIKW